MTETKPSMRRTANDIKIAVLFLTRLPFAHAAPVEGADIARAGWAMPIAGALVGAIGAAVYWLAFRLGLAPLVCATLTVAATLGVTGCLHEDGLADTADGFGGGATRERKLAIMRDSRTGTYGACALVLSILLRVGSLAALAEPALVAPALIAAHVAARATLPIFMRLTPPARADGLSAGAGRPSLGAAVTAGLIGAAALALALPVTTAFIGMMALAAAIGCIAWISNRQIGGQTGDVAGALEQAGESLVLLVATIT
ncbi:MAG: adenosylcobinamide-GDP ribazoletransferase [Rhodoplanes sp.]